jgi:hypothetical protein
MVNQREKAQMRDYVMSHLEGSGETITPKSKEVVPGITSNYLLVGKTGEAASGAVILVDQKYPKSTLRQLNEVFTNPRNNIANIAYVLFKDGETFFRSAAAGEEETGIHSKRSKLRDDRSLKNYTDEDLRRMISFRPEEEFCMSRNSGWIQYYQPQSDRLEEGVVSYKFSPVTFDYSHLSAEARFGPETKDSERLRIWAEDKRISMPGPLKLDGRYLKPRA